MVCVFLHVLDYFGIRLEPTSYICKNISYGNFLAHFLAAEEILMLFGKKISKCKTMRHYILLSYQKVQILQQITFENSARKKEKGIIVLENIFQNV